MGEDEVYYYKAKCTKVVDGDTIRAKVELGFRLTFEDNFRLDGIDTPEIRDKDPEAKSKAYEAKDYLASRILDKDIIIYTKKSGKYGRYLATVFYDSVNINIEMLQEGYAKEYGK